MHDATSSQYCTKQAETINCIQNAIGLSNSNARVPAISEQPLLAHQS